MLDGEIWKRLRQIGNSQDQASSLLVLYVGLGVCFKLIENMHGSEYLHGKIETHKHTDSNFARRLLFPTF